MLWSVFWGLVEVNGGLKRVPGTVVMAPNTVAEVERAALDANDGGHRLQPIFVLKLLHNQKRIDKSTEGEGGAATPFTQTC